MTPSVFISHCCIALLCSYNNNYNFCHLQWAASPLNMTQLSEQGSTTNASQLCSMHLCFFSSAWHLGSCFCHCLLSLSLPLTLLAKCWGGVSEGIPWFCAILPSCPAEIKNVACPMNPKHLPRICCWVSQVFSLPLLIIFFYNFSLRKLLNCMPACSLFCGLSDL